MWHNLTYTSVPVHTFFFSTLPSLWFFSVSLFFVKPINWRSPVCSLPVKLPAELVDSVTDLHFDGTRQRNKKHMRGLVWHRSIFAANKKKEKACLIFSDLSLTVALQMCSRLCRRCPLCVCRRSDPAGVINAPSTLGTTSNLGPKAA